MSRIIDYKDRTTCVIFGDGPGAVVVSPAVEPDLCILDFAHEVDGSGRTGAADAGRGQPVASLPRDGGAAVALRASGRCGGLQVRRP